MNGDTLERAAMGCVDFCYFMSAAMKLIELLLLSVIHDLELLYDFEVSIKELLLAELSIDFFPLLFEFEVFIELLSELLLSLSEELEDA